MSFFYIKTKENEEDINNDTEKSDWNYSHTPLINQSNANSNRLVKVRQSPNSQLILEHSMKTSKDNALTKISDHIPSQNKNIRTDHLSLHTLDGFEIIIKLISGYLLGKESFTDAYTDVEETTNNKVRKILETYYHKVKKF